MTSEEGRVVSKRESRGAVTSERERERERVTS